jgi:hypothetical protein
LLVVLKGLKPVNGNDDRRDGVLRIQRVAGKNNTWQGRIKEKGSTRGNPLSELVEFARV